MAEQGHLFKIGRDIANVELNPLNTRFVIDHRHGPGELRRSADGELLATLPGRVNDVDFSPDAKAGVFVVGYAADRPGELRRSADGELLATLGGDLAPGEVTFQPRRRGRGIRGGLSRWSGANSG